MSNEVHTITNDELFNEIEASINRIKERIIDELILSDDELLLDDIIDGIQQAIEQTKIQKKVYWSWIFKHEIPEEFIYDPGKEDIIEDDEEELDS